MPFLPSRWRAWGRLAPGRPAGAVASPHNAWDAIWSAAAYLCGSSGRVTDVRAAVRRYNHSDAYVNRVLAKASEYEAAAKRLRVSTAGRVCPVAGPITHSNDWHAPRSGRRRHQGNDIFAPSGTVLVAVENGVVDRTTDVETGLGGVTLWLVGDSGTRWHYAHNSRNLLTRGVRVRTGQPVTVIGNTGNARGLSMHVHFEMHPGGGRAANPFALISKLCSE